MLFTAWGCAGVAVAQPGDGIKVGDARLHPSFHMEPHYIYNPGLLPPGQEISDIYALFRPGLQLELASPKLELKLDGSYEWRQYFGIEDEATADHLTTWAAQLGGDALFNKEGAFTLRLHEAFARQVDAANQSITTVLKHITNDAGLGFDVKPGGGALIVSADYNFYYDRYDRNDNAIPVPQALDNYRHRPALRATWKFLPKTAVFLQATGQLTQFPQGNATVVDSTGTPQTFHNPNSNILQSYAGLAGSITPKINALLKAGYGYSSVQGVGGAFSSVVGQGEVTYSPYEALKLKLGGLRSVEPVPLFSFMDLIRGYVRYDHTLGGKTTLGLGVDVDLLRFGTSVTPGVPSGRNDVSLSVNASIEHAFNDWLALGIFNRLTLRNSDADTAVGAADYRTDDIFARLAVRY